MLGTVVGNSNFVDGEAGYGFGAADTANFNGGLRIIEVEAETGRYGRRDYGELRARVEQKMVVVRFGGGTFRASACKKR